jgi:DNA-binding transcriptional regulator YiaG
MKPGSKYYRLLQHLQNCDQTEITMTIAEVEELVEGSLPPNARQIRSWWSNRDSPSAAQAKAWIMAGFHTTFIDLPKEIITFGKFSTTYNIRTRDDGGIIWDRESVKALRKHMGLTQIKFSKELGVRRQTVSEWENGVYSPDRSTTKHLERVADGSEFQPPEENDQS